MARYPRLDPAEKDLFGNPVFIYEPRYDRNQRLAALRKGSSLGYFREEKPRPAAASFVNKHQFVEDWISRNQSGEARLLSTPELRNGGAWPLDDGGAWPLDAGGAWPLDDGGARPLDDGDFASWLKKAHRLKVGGGGAKPLRVHRPVSTISEDQLQQQTGFLNQEREFETWLNAAKQQKALVQKKAQEEREQQKRWRDLRSDAAGAGSQWLVQSLVTDSDLDQFQRWTNDVRRKKQHQMYAKGAQHLSGDKHLSRNKQSGDKVQEADEGGESFLEWMRKGELKHHTEEGQRPKSRHERREGRRAVEDPSETRRVKRFPDHFSRVDTPSGTPGTDLGETKESTSVLLNHKRIIPKFWPSNFPEASAMTSEGALLTGEEDLEGGGPETRFSDLTAPADQPNPEATANLHSQLNNPKRRLKLMKQGAYPVPSEDLSDPSLNLRTHRPPRDRSRLLPEETIIFNDGVLLSPSR